jgi:hypothetical protein
LRFCAHGAADRAAEPDVACSELAQAERSSRRPTRVIDAANVIDCSMRIADLINKVTSTFDHIVADLGPCSTSLAACRPPSRRRILRADEYQIARSDVWYLGPELAADILVRARPDIGRGQAARRNRAGCTARAGSRSRRSTGPCCARQMVHSSQARRRLHFPRT